MTAKSDYLENKVLDHVLRNTSYTPATTIYIGLFTSNPDEDGSGTEVSGNGYARQSIAFDAASGGSCLSSALVSFGTPTPSDWGTITHVGIFDADTGGNLLYYGAVTAPRITNTTDLVEFAAGDVTISEG